VLISRLFFWLVLLMPSLSHGRPVTHIGTTVDAVDLASVAEVIQLHPQLSILEDQTARLDIDGALASPDCSRQQRQVSIAAIPKRLSGCAGRCTTVARRR